MPQSQKNKQPLISHKELLRLLSYSGETGIFIWLQDRNFGQFQAGSRAGHRCNSLNYRAVKIFGRTYKEHRLAWFYIHGEWPPEMVDHVDGDPTNNKIANLRLATRKQNAANRKVDRKHSVGLKGVSRSGNRFYAKIYFEEKLRALGGYATAEEAHAAYCMAAKKLRGEFARFA